MVRARLTTAQARRIAWWQKARFGMFIHWGVYSASNLDCWTIFDQGMPVAEYIDRYEKGFNPTRFDADTWMAVAKSAGCKYVVMGARYHEGYGCTGEWAWPFNNGPAPWNTTRRGNTLYLHLLRYPGREFGIDNMHGYQLVSAELLDRRALLKIHHEPTRDVISGLPAGPPTRLCPW